MKIEYFSKTDTLYINLSDSLSNSSLEIRDGLVIDLDEKDKIVGIEIEHASKIIDISKLEINRLPFLKKIAVA